MKSIRIVQRHQTDAIVRLRMECYSKAREFRLLQPESLNWSEEDRRSIVLAAWDGTTPISTTRALMVRSATEAETAMGCSVELPSREFPAIILGRGATLGYAARAGLHSALRYYALQSAMAFGVRSLLGMVYSNAPRTNLMRDIGYTFMTPARVWDPEVEVIEPVLVGHLSEEHFSSAKRQLESLLHNTLCEYPWVGEPMNWITPLQSGTQSGIASQFPVLE